MRTHDAPTRPRLRWGGPRWRILLGAAVAVVAIVGLAWQHHQQHNTAAPTTPAQTTTAVAAPPPDPGDLGDVSAGQLEPPTVRVDVGAVAAARDVVTRFATNFGSPNGNRDDWLARISPDLSGQLIEQYRLTDIRNVTQAAVSAVDGPVRQAPASVTFDITYTDGSQIEVRLETGPDGWKAVDVVPRNSDGLPAPADTTSGDPQTSPVPAGATSTQESR